MGSGKSTLGQSLADAFGISWLDLDDEFELRYKVSIPAFFEKYGEQAFRELEHKILVDISLMPDLVVSTGGGSPCYHENMILMNQTGITVYLKAMPELLISRIELSARKRPLFQQMQGENFQQKINLHLQSREPYYSQAKIIIDATKPDIEELKKKILNFNTIISGV
jgi:shikimate kinase